MTVKNLINSIVDRSIYKFIVNFKQRVYHINNFEELVSSYGNSYIYEYEIDYTKRIITIDLTEEDLE